jgi:hypothetical protein
MMSSPESKTERAHYKFTVKEYGNGKPWLMCEPMDRELDIVGDGFLGRDLPEGTTYEEAQRIARFVNENITHVSYTSFLRHS